MVAYMFLSPLMSLLKSHHRSPRKGVEHINEMKSSPLFCFFTTYILSFSTDTILPLEAIVRTARKLVPLDITFWTLNLT